MIKAEKLKTYEEGKFKPGYASVKRNGIHGIFDPREAGFYSRTPKTIIGLDHLVPDLMNSPYPLVGELSIPNEDFETSSGLIRSSNSTPTAIFEIFNSIVPNSTFKERYDELKTLYDIYFKNNKCIKIEHHEPVYNIESFNLFYENQMAKGEEGVCWISPDHIYQPGKRGWNWMKRVPMRSIEATIIDILPGTVGKKYEHSMGRMVCKMANGKEFKVGIFKGQTDEWRQSIYDESEVYIGEEIVVEFKDFTKYGVPAQARYKAFRWDL